MAACSSTAPVSPVPSAEAVVGDRASPPLGYRLVAVGKGDEALLEATRELFREYQKWLNFDLSFQQFDDELRLLPGNYAEPHGRLFLVVADSGPAENGAPLTAVPVACVALRPESSGIGEMKRLYVREGHRKAGLGRYLAALVTTEARIAGYEALRLDTLRNEQFAAANRLYESLGFTDIGAYRVNPFDTARFMEKRL